MDLRRKIAVFVLAFLTLVVAVYGGWMIKHHMDYAITNAVFVDTDNIVNVGFERVAGRIVEMTKLEGDWVKKGEVLARLDTKDYELQVKAIEKQIEALRTQKRELEVTLSRITPQLKLAVEKARAGVRAIEKQIKATEEEVRSVDAQIEQIKRDRDRFYRLYRKGAAARHSFEELDTRLRVLVSQKGALERKVDALREQKVAAVKDLNIALKNLKRIGETKLAIERLERQIEALSVRLKDARLQLSYCVLKSPVEGRVAKKYRSTGDVVAPGTPVYALVDPEDIFILVLLEETKLKGVKPGSPAKIRIDALPDEEYEGVVDKILPTSAAKFALVPRDISAGEFTKVVQRFPVKVKITKGDVGRLVIGMGGEIEIKRIR